MFKKRLPIKIFQVAIIINYETNVLVGSRWLEFQITSSNTRVLRLITYSGGKTSGYF